jgi:spore maturation protein CgeB
MHLAVFGLSVTSSWGNGHATFWRAICRSLARRGHHVEFFERDQPFYRAHRDLDALPDHTLHLYADWGAMAGVAESAVRRADAVIVTSYCADARSAAALTLDQARGVRAFYDMDTPVTLERLRAGETVEYLPAGGLSDFDVVLSYAGGPALTALESELGARQALPIYGCIDPDEYPVQTGVQPEVAVTYLGTYAADRAAAFHGLLLTAARACPAERFVVGGPQYPDAAAWPSNVEYRAHVGQPEHLASYASGRFTLNLTRGAMRTWGFCPSGRLFEAAACGTPLLTDDWLGLPVFFDPGDEVVVVRSPEDIRDALGMSDGRRKLMASRARDRVLATCTADIRAADLEAALSRRTPVPMTPMRAGEGE